MINIKSKVPSKNTKGAFDANNPAGGDGFAWKALEKEVFSKQIPERRSKEEF